MIRYLKCTFNGHMTRAKNRIKKKYIYHVHMYTAQEMCLHNVRNVCTQTIYIQIVHYQCKYNIYTTNVRVVWTSIMHILNVHHKCT